MRAGVISLVLAYVLSQFYRAFLAVLAPALKAELGATPADLSYASGMWFVAFAAMQIPVGAALDRVGPRRTAAVLFALGGAGGALVCALAQSPLHIVLGMVLLGIGCSPVLMAAYFIFARIYSAAVFGTLAGVVLGVGSLGNVASSVPLAWAAEVFGWRGTLFVLAAISLGLAVLIAAFVSDPPRAGAEKRGSVLDILRIPAMWLILPLGEWVLREACRASTHMRASFAEAFGVDAPAPFMSLNMSTAQLQAPDIYPTVRRALTDSGAVPQAIKLEITEGLLMADPELARLVLDALKAMGCRIAQGFHYSMPLAEEDFRWLLETHSTLPLMPKA